MLQPIETDFAEPGVLSRICAGTFDDPFAILGPHRKGRVRHVTCYDPGAEEMTAISAGKDYPLAPVAGFRGIFHGKVSGTKPYRLRGSRGAESWEVDDPYRFGPVLGEIDEYLLGEGTHRRLWRALGAHVTEHEGTRGTHFAVWAPNARRVSVVAGFNGWDGRRHVMRRRGATGVWEFFMPGIGEGEAYKYEILGAHGELHLKSDPVGFGAQHPPETASVVRDISGYGWHDASWMERRAATSRRDRPISIYEVHLGSWRRKEGGRSISYKEAAVELVDYAKDMGFTHIELMPISEYPFDGSWGYQPVGLYAPTIRFGPPHEFRDLVDAAHAAGLGVLVDWVPGHFPTDPHGLGRFDGTPLYEHSDPREGFHHDWNTLIYNYGRTEVKNFLTSNALFWLDEYHLDGLRVDAVASMIYRDYSRKEGEWIPNAQGGRENLEAIEMLRAMNTLAYGEIPGIFTVAEESTAFGGVSAPADAGGLGFGYKWNMGWMNDTLDYISRDPIHRKHHHHQMTFGLHYAFSENFILPISHDEVVHGKRSMLSKMPGDEWEKFGNLRAYYGFMWGHPGKKLLFMGQEFGQWQEWNHDAEADWACLVYHMHRGVQDLVRDLNRLYADTPALHAKDCEPEGFQWIEAGDADASVFAWIRRGGPEDPEVVVACNFTPVDRSYRLGFPQAGRWREAINTDADCYGGSGRGNLGGIVATAGDWQGQPAQAQIALPPLSTIIFVKDAG
ncbi:1,4-alpha-glucan branching protein GlgB [Celeribacter indicus]|uniref:1,4-alpha-glucan branching enzyme GlgB n=1 Tax=Celeribacter indicus TaxID=1208324 RepID=A0A0B5E621_9RHOB|nr:1,4-alpha-glucan branching protein GlgB [Celeribacter indicus]AJE47782.1 glycogen branching enzyme [Celeribacter indicus]SDW22694.1 1,4-alpha-glucan branching enzyme [Celeribacter indicus]